MTAVAGSPPGAAGLGAFDARRAVRAPAALVTALSDVLDAR